MYSIEEIARVIRGDLKKGCPVTISEYGIDSRSVIYADQTLFFALKGQNHDAHDYILSLYENGVRAFVIHEYRSEFDRLTEANFIRVDHVLSALQQLAAHYRQQSKAEIIGITGSNGKTIVKEWLSQLLMENYRVYRSPRSYNSQVGVPLSLLGIEEETEIAVIEAGISQKGEMQRLEQMIRPDIGLFTHIGEAHDENFTSTEEKLTEKAKLFTSCKTLVGQAGEVLKFIKKQLPDRVRLFLWGIARKQP